MSRRASSSTVASASHLDAAVHQCFGMKLHHCHHCFECSNHLAPHRTSMGLPMGQWYRSRQSMSRSGEAISGNLFSTIFAYLRTGPHPAFPGVGEGFRFCMRSWKSCSICCARSRLRSKALSRPSLSRCERCPFCALSRCSLTVRLLSCISCATCSRAIPPHKSLLPITWSTQEHMKIRRFRLRTTPLS